MTEPTGMSPSKPYLLRAIYEWIVDNGMTPHLLVNTEDARVRVPTQFVKDNSIVLIDVRNRDEVQTLGKIPTSHNLPRELLLQTLPIQMTSRVLGS